MVGKTRIHRLRSQSGRVATFTLSGWTWPYTPQVIVDGLSELKLNDAKQIGDVVLKAVKAPQVPMSISAMSVEGNAPAILRASVKADGSSDKHNADVFAAVAIDRAESQVLRGENSGRHLSHVAVVQELVKIGKLQKGRTFDQNIQINLKPGLDPENLRLVVFIQETNYGDVLGSALQKDGVSGK